MNTPENNLITLHVDKEMTSLFKTFLEILHEIHLEHPDVIDSKKYEILRKRVLDTGNDKLRNVLQFLEYFDFIINKEKVELAATQRRVVKKFVTTSAPIIQ